MHKLITAIARMLGLHHPAVTPTAPSEADPWVADAPLPIERLGAFFNYRLPVAKVSLKLVVRALDGLMDKLYDEKLGEWTYELYMDGYRIAVRLRQPNQIFDWDYTKSQVEELLLKSLSQSLGALIIVDEPFLPEESAPQFAAL